MYKRLLILAALFIPAALLNILVAWWLAATQADATRHSIDTTHVADTPLTSWPAEFKYPYTDTQLFAHLRSRGRDIYQYTATVEHLVSENTTGTYIATVPRQQGDIADETMQTIPESPYTLPGGTVITGNQNTIDSFFAPPVSHGQVDTWVYSDAYLKLQAWGWPWRTLAQWEGDATDWPVTVPTGEPPTPPEKSYVPRRTTPAFGFAMPNAPTFRTVNMQTWDAPHELRKEEFTFLGVTYDLSAIPLKVLPLGAILNTLFYAILLYIPFELFFITRFATRTRHGRCRKCGYDIAGLTTCPECGKAVPTK